VRWIREYNGTDLPADLAAGVTLGAVLVPSGLAYGEMAGLPMAGLYACLLPLVAYAVVSGSRLLAVGSDTTMASFVALTLAPMAQGDATRLAALVALLGTMIAAAFLIAGLLRLGFMADFLSKPVIVGFTHGLAILIVAVQLPKLLGLPRPAGTPLVQLIVTLGRLAEANPISAGIGIASVAVVLGSRQLRSPIPGQIVVLVTALAASYAFDLRERGVAVVGAIPSGLPGLSLPAVSWADVRAVVPLALGLALVMFSDTIVTARGFAARTRTSVDANRELFALSASNLAAALGQGLPVSGNGSPTAVAFSAGGRTQATPVFGAVTVALVLLFFTTYLDALPVPALAGILVAAAYSLCDFPELARLWRFRGVALATALAVMIGVAGVGVMEGIGLGVIISLVLVLKVLAFPNDAVLGRTPDGFHELARHPGAQPVPGAIVYRFAAPLFFANASMFQARVRSLLDSAAEPVATFVLDAAVIFEVDIAACDALNEVATHLRTRGIRFAIARLSPHVAPTIERGGVTAYVGPDNFFPSIAAALAGPAVAADPTAAAEGPAR
jgi:SulP family sulfate permease